MRQAFCRLVEQHGQKDWIVLAVLDEETIKPISTIAATKTDSRQWAGMTAMLRPDGNGLLEQRYAGLLPELATEQVRRVGSKRYHGSGCHDGGIEETWCICR